MSDTSTPPPPPAPEPLRPSPRAPRSERFFSWVRGFGISRTDGWLGGVCAGIATRIGIDPAIVRGIVVVTALFGFPMLVLYAMAWALLPDATGTIHLRELMRGGFDPAMVGIGILTLVGLIPIFPWFTIVFTGSASYSWFDASPLRALGTLASLVVLGAIVYFIVRGSRRSPSRTRPAKETFETHVAPASGTSMLAAPAEPPAPATESADDLAAWRTQHEHWRMQHDQWRRDQIDAEQAAREEARRERDAAATAFAAEANERRRIQRWENPRTSGTFLAIATGGALVIGAAVSLWSAAITPDGSDLVAAFGLFAAALTLATSMVVAGALRRRSGFLAFLTVAMLFSGAIATVAPVTISEVNAQNQYVDNTVGPWTASQDKGNLSIYVSVVEPRPAPIEVSKRDGSTTIEVQEGVELELDMTLGSDVVLSGDIVDYASGEGRAVKIPVDSSAIGGAQRINRTFAFSDAAVQTTQVLTLTQESGSVWITFATDEGVPLTDTTVTSSSTETKAATPTPEVTP
ncbi:phage shock protein PspC (stress-responsive transcriptional regulator) [Microbacterium endophyticum]|uniref:Phage shock protein PspC (Stress-responsive transcriptional regulator) n=1 Tax=Microbacterium endophyticum TaxID=1526412 RepID=A0A7W4V2F3_9MICO|nr:PspC domain-containing protein [Microbacterium endophyticum]MBB2975632.1 phage shock protein PspC (stress-responsive transcriptional regulator) [Microbacterium endophyticum]NIK35349.1 phage shock protein PspC (stress-responsive transcriptional regulator) [Microbacterium endophyticum]